MAANTYLPSIDSLITASSEYGAQGVVEMDTVETDIGSGLVVLPDRLKDGSVNLAERCTLSLKGDVSSFFLSGQGGLPMWSRVNYVSSVFLGEEDREEGGCWKPGSCLDGAIGTSDSLPCKDLLWHLLASITEFERTS